MLRPKRALLFVKDLRRVAAFYGDALGLSIARESPGWIELDAPGLALAFHAIPAAIADAIVIRTPPVAREQTPIKLVFETDDLAADRARLIALGAVMGEITAWGACDGLDPEGNVFQICAGAARPAAP